MLSELEASRKKLELSRVRYGKEEREFKILELEAKILQTRENIEIQNLNLYFKNEYRWQNITESRRLTESIAYDSFRNDFQIYLETQCRISKV